jgi:hypothetical protein
VPGLIGSGTYARVAASGSGVGAGHQGSADLATPPTIVT